MGAKNVPPLTLSNLESDKENRKPGVFYTVLSPLSQEAEDKSPGLQKLEELSKSYELAKGEANIEDKSDKSPCNFKETPLSKVTDFFNSLKFE